MKNLLLAILTLASLTGFAQGTSVSFIDYQRTLPRPAEALAKKEDTLKKRFAQKGLVWPARYMYIRSFKYDGEMEVWVKNERKDAFKLFHTYKVCALAGTLGPKRMEGDYQVPEGFYYINEFNPRSNYYLSLGLNYPNVSDRLLSDYSRPGGDIYIHGSCVTVGCIPVRDEQIQEIYILAAYARAQGEDFIPVHLFPIRYSNKRSSDYLNTLTVSDPALKQFSERLEAVYDHFEATHQLPVIMTNKTGDYVYDGLSKKVALPPPPAPRKYVPVPHRVREVTNLAEVVTAWPVFPGGGQSFLKYLDQMGNAMVADLPQGTKKANVQVEFIVDADGVPTNFTVIKGVNPEFDDKMITVLEQMPTWEPAILNDKPVAKKMRQSFSVE